MDGYGLLDLQIMKPIGNFQEKLKQILYQIVGEFLISLIQNMHLVWMCYL